MVKAGSDGTAASVRDESVAELLEYLRLRENEISRVLAQRYKEKIVEYRSLSDSFIEEDVISIARQNLQEMLAMLSPTDRPTGRRLDVFRNSSIRRFRQGVPIQALLHAYRLWGQTVWEEVVKAPEILKNPEIGLQVAARIMEHVDEVSTAVAESYLEEAAGVIQDREVVRRDLLEALIAGSEINERVESNLRRFGLDGNADVTVMLIRQRHLGKASPESLRRSLEFVRNALAARMHERPLIGVRDEEIVIIHPLTSITHTQLRETAHELAVGLPSFVVGISRPFPTLRGVSEGYLEAQNAIMSAPASPAKPRAYAFTDALLHHILRTSNFRNELYEETVLPLIEYDQKRGTELLSTLRTYVDLGFSLAQTAAAIQVQPNTVRYRLKRISEITGHDPLDPDDLILLALGVRLPAPDGGNSSTAGGAGTDHRLR